MSGDSGEQITVRALTKRKPNGDLYERRAEVEEQLVEVLRLSPDELAKRIPVPNRQDPRYLFDETLVYLLKEAHRRNDLTMENLIYDHLSIRVEILLRKQAGQVSRNDSADLVQETHRRIIKKIFNLDSDKSDYAEVMFGNFVTSEAGTVKKNHWRLETKERGYLEIDAPKEDGHDYDPPDEWSLSPEQSAMLGNALNKIPERTVTAYLLHYRDGFQIESKDPDEPTVARVFGVTGRTIRNWFRDAVKQLTEDEGGNDET
ncbi:MAG: sigma-70 family RNA polymerase sigma factor [Aridibacter famidurans]|nr:sigma-70 family RNA polymerase sigma factor [Aridibacter famidurans]